MGRTNQQGKRWISPLIGVLLISAIAVAIPLSTENMTISSKLKRLSILTNYNLNRIITFQDNPNLPVLCNQTNQFRIVHIGDSHIQAGFFTDEVRQLLTNYVNDSIISEGYAFPYNLAGTNSPREYTFASTGNWKFSKVLGSTEPIGAGLSGMVMETTDSVASINISLKNKKFGDRCFNQLTIFYTTTEKGYTPTVNSVSAEIASQSPNHITFKLDSSVNEASISFHKIPKSSSALSISGIEAINNSSNVIYNSAGLNGADVKSYLLASELPNQLKTIDPQLVIISLGTNDAYHPLFEKSIFSNLLDSLINEIKASVPDATVLLTIPGDHLVSRATANPKLIDVKNAILTIAEKNHCCVWDFHSLMGGEGSIRTWNKMELTAPDLLHLNPKGYQLQGELLFDAITCDEFMPKN
ncbi:hypothetical protein CYCD_13730 [Tenuifilaceae bacterium CYCD]|nr:hypothetical protein CYCD_13730 [Tenuifilaceae bacterium CYCD]